VSHKNEALSQPWKQVCDSITHHHQPSTLYIECYQHTDNFSLKTHVKTVCDTYSGNFTEIRFKMNMADIW